MPFVQGSRKTHGSGALAPGARVMAPWKAEALAYAKRALYNSQKEPYITHRRALYYPLQASRTVKVQHGRSNLLDGFRFRFRV